MMWVFLFNTHFCLKDYSSYKQLIIGNTKFIWNGVLKMFVFAFYPAYIQNNSIESLYSLPEHENQYSWNPGWCLLGSSISFLLVYIWNKDKGHTISPLPCLKPIFFPKSTIKKYRSLSKSISLSYYVAVLASSSLTWS